MRRVSGKIAFVLALTFATATPVISGPFENGLMAFDKGEYAVAMQIWRPLAVAGDMRAQYRLASLYGRGSGVDRDDEQVVRWMSRAAHQGYVTAQSRLGFMYEFGERLPPNYEQALRWYRAAALQGDEFAAGRLNLINEVSHRIAKR